MGGENNVMNPKVKGEIGMYVNSRPKILDKNLIDSKNDDFERLCITPGIRTLGTGSNTRNRVRQVTTTFSGEYAIFILSDRQRY